MKYPITISIISLISLGLAANLFSEGNARQETPKHPSHQRPDKFKDRRLEANPRHRANGDERILLLKRMMDLPPERLDMMQATIRRIQSLSPGEKARLRDRLENFGRMPDQEKRRLLENFKNDERKRWDEFRSRHKHLPPDQRNREQRRIHSLPPHERRDYFEQLHRNKRPHGGGPHPPPHSPRHEGSPPGQPPHRR